MSNIDARLTALEAVAPEDIIHLDADGSVIFRWKARPGESGATNRKNCLLHLMRRAEQVNPDREILRLIRETAAPPGAVKCAQFLYALMMSGRDGVEPDSEQSSEMVQ